jgi:hypothetical protein
MVNARNLALSVAVYASLVRAAGLRLDFPGSAAAFGAMTQVVDAGQLAEAAPGRDPRFPPARA